MLARYLRRLLLLEFLGTLALAAWGATHGVFGVPGVVFVMLGLPLIGRAAWVGGMLLAAPRLTWPRAPRAPIGAWARVRLFLREWLTLIRVFTLVQPFERRWMAADALRVLPAGDLPVVLVHGYRCNRAIWWWMRRALQARGYTVATLNLEPLLGDIDDYARALGERVEQVLQATGAPQVSLVGHSMGGLVALAYLREAGAAHVANFVSIGTPFRGSPYARFGAGRSALQMCPGNPWAEALQRWKLPDSVRATCICSAHDPMISPDSALLPDAQPRVLRGLGHLEMAWSDAVCAVVCEALEGPAMEVQPPPDSDAGTGSVAGVTPSTGTPARTPTRLLA